jgi:hypothetical protein
MNNQRRIVLATVCAWVVYAAFYVLNSFLGGYHWEFVSDGSSGYSVNGKTPIFGTRTAVLWQPRLGYMTATERDSLGFMFAPLIHLDRTLWHPSVHRDDTNYLKWLSGLNRSDVHPNTREFFVGYKPLNDAEPRGENSPAKELLQINSR